MADDFYIKITSPQGIISQKYLAADCLTMGRSSRNDVIISDILASRFHAEIIKREDYFFVRDLGSKNGTLLNGKSLKSEIQLEDGDEIKIGKWSVVFYAGAMKGADLPVSVSEAILSETSSVDFHTTTVDAPLFISELKSDKSGKMLSGRILTAVYEFGLQLVSYRDVDEVLNNAISRLIELTDAERGLVYFLDEKTGKLHQQAALVKGNQEKNLKTLSKTITNLVLNEKKSVMAYDALLDDRLRKGESIIGQQIRSIMCAPLWSEDKIYGMVYIDSLTKPNLFSEDDIQLMTIFTNMIATTIKNILLIKEDAEKRIELKEAIRIHKNLLPSTFPQIDGYDIAALNLACMGVGGDYYDFLSDRDEGLGVVIADVAGKGLSAALLMSNVQATLRAIATDWDQCLSLLPKKINKAVCRNIPTNKFVSFFIACLHPDTGKIQFCNAGHNPPILLKKNGENRLLKEGGPVLGVLANAEYVTGEEIIENGDILTLYSDGIVEEENKVEEEYGTERFISAIRDHSNMTSHEIVEAVEEDIDRFSEGAPHKDDLTLIIIKRL